MLFICNTTIEPDARDETMARFMEHGVVEPGRARNCKGPGLEVAQQEAWCVLEADSAEAIMAPFDAWGTDSSICTKSRRCWISPVLFPPPPRASWKPRIRGSRGLALVLCTA